MQGPEPRRRLPAFEKKRVSGRRDIVTIAVGFRCLEGAMLCADTKHTGQMALYDPKLFHKKYPNGARSIIAIVGNSSYACMGVRKCEAKLGGLSSPTLDQMVDTIESVLLEIHVQHIHPHPDRSTVEGPDFWLLMALWSPVDGLRTYSTAQTSVAPFPVYYCEGAGAYLGHYIIKPRYTDPHSHLAVAVSVAFTALQRIKSYDPDCGGYSQFLTLSNEGQISPVGQHEISQGEAFTEGFHDYAEFLYERLCDLDLPGNEVNKQFESFKKLVLQVRTKHQRDRETRKLLDELLAELTPSVPRKISSH
jgi:hypothetical protein